MVVAALKICIVYYCVVLTDTLLAWQTLTRPIVIAPLIGLVLGDFTTGIIMGATLESIFMGISAIGGSVPADATSASVISVAFIVLTGTDIDTGLGLALPIGTAMVSISSIFTPFWASLAPFWEKLAAQCNPKKFLITSLGVAAVQPLINTTILFLAIAFGIDGLNEFIAMLPAWVMTGLGSASSMMIAIGFAILTSMIWDNEVGVFLLVGYVCVAYLGMATLAVAIVGAAVAITLFFIEKRNIDLKTMLMNTSINDDEEEFF